ncbi:MAG: hypothetical protein VW621_06435, partial [Betaproteobacteria bacterium]
PEINAAKIVKSAIKEFLIFTSYVIKSYSTQTNFFYIPITTDDNSSVVIGMYDLFSHRPSRP